MSSISPSDSIGPRVFSDPKEDAAVVGVPKPEAHLGAESGASLAGRVTAPSSIEYETHSSYIIRRGPKERYGVHPSAQDIFNSKSDAFIKTLIERFKEKGIGLEDLLEACGIERQNAAIEMGDPRALDFGESIRHIKGGGRLVSCLSNYSKEYASKIRDKIMPLIVEIEHADLHFRVVSYDEELAPFSENNMKYINIFQDIQDFYPTSSKELPAVVEVVREIEINGKKYPICSYLYDKDHPEREAVRHLPSTYHKDLLKEIEKIFEVAMTWNEWGGEDLSSIIDVVGHLQYLMANACLYTRGSASICDWVEKFIYRYHGLEVEYHVDKCINLEAITSSLEEFLEAYPSCIRLKRAEMSPAAL
jgi:hypothetical protein